MVSDFGCSIQIKFYFARKLSEKFKKLEKLSDVLFNNPSYDSCSDFNDLTNGFAF